MCGIAGIYSQNTGRESLESAARLMSEAIVHRGPDSHGLWTDSDLPFAISHRRLAILDLSEHGHQPMVSRSGRYVIVYNGEVYNYPLLRKELELQGRSFRGGSDTEVILEAIEQWGVAKATTRFNGMFAFGLWDRKEKELFLVRDRMGIKPLYYGWQGGKFLFASELKALVAAGNGGVVQRGAAALLLGLNYIPAPWSIYEGIYKLIPGTILKLTQKELDSRGSNFSPWAESSTVTTSITPGRPQRFWSLQQVIKSSQPQREARTASEALLHMEEVLQRSVERRMISDVPLGAFLSGGIDSSLVVALMQKASDRPVSTFSIGFHEAAYNEAHHAKAVAEHLRTNHTELYLSADEAMATIPNIPNYYDEPFSDASQIPTYLVSRLAREHVTVSLSGDGGDELFCGYTRYFILERLWESLKWLPVSTRKPLARLLNLCPKSFWRLLFSIASPFLPKRFQLHNAATKVQRLSEFLDASGGHANSLAGFYRCGVSHWLNVEEFFGESTLETFFEREMSQNSGLSGHEYMMFADSQTYLPDDILVKVDRASMAVSLEARVPLLDHEVVEAAWALPHTMRVREGESKWVLKEILKKHLPAELIDRPKMGFGIPSGEWIRGPLREWSEDLLSEKELRERGFLNPIPIRTAWKQHLDGVRDWQYYLWDVLMLQAWLKSRNATLG